MRAPPKPSGWTSRATAARPSTCAGLITSRWIGWRTSRRVLARCSASAGSQLQNTSVHPWNSRTARTRRSRRHQPSATPPGKELASRKTTSAAASPTRSDQTSSPNPRTSARASLMWSRLSSGSVRRSARTDASVDFPVPGAPETTTVRALGIPTGCRAQRCWPTTERQGWRCERFPHRALTSRSRCLRAGRGSGDRWRNVPHRAVFEVSRVATRPRESTRERRAPGCRHRRARYRRAAQPP